MEICLFCGWYMIDNENRVMMYGDDVYGNVNHDNDDDDDERWQ